MIELDEETMEKAVDRAYELNPRVSLITAPYAEQPEGAKRLTSGRKFLVSCESGEHPGGHVTRFRRHPADGSLSGECVQAATGEPCPAALGGHACYHLAGGVVLFLGLEARDRAGRPPRRRTARAAYVETPAARPLGPREEIASVEVGL